MGHCQEKTSKSLCEMAVPLVQLRALVRLRLLLPLLPPSSLQVVRAAVIFQEPTLQLFFVFRSRLDSYHMKVGAAVQQEEG